MTAVTEELRSLQLRLCQAYGVEPEPHVGPFVELIEGSASREVLYVRSSGDDLEVRLYLPREAVGEPRDRTLDHVCQLVEGVSHFVLIAERARRDLPTTRLELELQAEVDKFVVLLGPTEHLSACGVRARAALLRQALFERVRFVHAPSTRKGERYRIANRLAHGFTSRLSDELARRRDVTGALRRFHAAGPTEKLALARAA